MKKLLAVLVGVALSTQVQAKELKLKSSNVDLKNHSSQSLMKLDGSAPAVSAKYFVVQFENAITQRDDV